MQSMCDAQRDEIGMLDFQLVEDAMDFCFLDERDGILTGGNGEEAPRECKFLVVGRALGKLTSDLEVRRSTEEKVARFCQTDDEHGLIGREAALVEHEALHRRRFVGAGVLIGVRHTAEQIREAREVAGALRLQLIERADDIAQW